MGSYFKALLITTTMVAALFAVPHIQLQLYGANPITRTACQYLREEKVIPANTHCWQLPDPIVVKSNIVPYISRQLLGITWHHEPYIFINPGLSEELTEEVIFHETVHYIISYTGVVEGMTSCDNEEWARRLTDKWRGREYNPEWKVWYQCS